MYQQVVKEKCNDVLYQDLSPSLKAHLESKSSLTDAAIWMVSIISRHKGLRPEEVDVEQLLQPEHEILTVLHTTGDKRKILTYCHKLCAVLGDRHRFRNYAVGLVDHPLVIEWVRSENFSPTRQYNCQHPVSQFLRYLTGTAEFRRYLPEAFPFVMLQRRHLINYRRDLLLRIRRSQYSQNGARKVLQLVVRFVKWCQNTKGILSGLDLGRISIRRGPDRTRDVPTHETCERFYNYILFKRVSPSVRVCFLLAGATGARPGELLKLTFGDVDVKSRSIRLQSKEGAERWMPLGNNVWRALVEVLETQQPDRTNMSEVVLKDKKDNPLRYETLKGLVRQARTQGIHIDGMVAFRHRWATDALEAGMPWGLVCYYLGHKNPDELHRYQHLQKRYLFEQVQQAFRKRGLPR